MQKVQLIGNLGGDSEARVVGNDGKHVLSFSVAVNQGDKLPTLWVRVSYWDHPEWMPGALTKGVKVFVEGRLNAGDNGGPRVYATKDGGSGASYEVTAHTVIVLSGSGDKPATAADNQDIPF